MVTVKFFIQMVTIMKENGKMICFIKKENIHAKMDIPTKVNGIKEKKKEKVFKAGKMDRFILDNLKKVLNMVKE